MKLKKKDFPKVMPAEWVKPARRFYYMGCCDCGLVHKLEFKLMPTTSGSGIYMRAWRDEPRTRALRKRHGITVKHG